LSTSISCGTWLKCDIVTDKGRRLFYTAVELKTQKIGDGGMNPFIAFMASPVGRIVRVVAGAALIGYGLLGLGGPIGVIVAIVGAVPFLAGLLDVCVFAPLFGNPFSGRKIRAGN
jgi:sulfite exporter TauE/SafE